MDNKPPNYFTRFLENDKEFAIKQNITKWAETSEEFKEILRGYPLEMRSNARIILIEYYTLLVSRNFINCHKANR